VHGFASSTKDNWVATGWVRDLLRAGYRVIGSTSAATARATSRTTRATTPSVQLAGDVETVLDTYLVDEALYVGYPRRPRRVGGRAGHRRAHPARHPGRRARRHPLARLDIDQVRAFVEDGTPSPTR
jgi:hypothetical protein